MGKSSQRIFIADEGKVFISKIDGAILTERLILGVKDSIDNYEQIDKPSDEDTEDGKD